MESVESEFDELFDIDTWRKGGFVNHYKALYEERNMVGYDEGAFDNYIFEQENTIKVNKKIYHNIWFNTVGAIQITSS